MSKCIIILGPHRSGTSAFAGSLHSGGVPFGEGLLPPGNYNKKGYFENKELVAFNDELLKNLGSSWHELHFLSKQNSSITELLSRFDERAKQLILKLIGKKEKIGLKDPRLCILLPFWIKIIKERLNLDLEIILVFRNPESTVSSLMKRNNFSLDKAIFITHSYLVCAEKFSRNEKRTLVDFDDFVNQTKIILNKINEKHQLNIDLNQAAFAIDNSLIHTPLFINKQQLNYRELEALHKAIRDNIDVTKNFNKAWKSLQEKTFIYKTRNKREILELTQNTVKVFFSKPFSLLKKINAANIRTLIKALKEENAQTIISNLKKLLE